MERAAAALTNIMSELLRRVPVQDAPLLAWPAVCGQAVAARTRALQFAAGRLLIEVPDAAWRAQLAELEAHYRRQFAALLGRNQVRQIDFIAAGAK